MSDINFTYGQTERQTRWDDQRTLSWEDFSKLFETAPIGPKSGTCFTPAVFSGFQRKMDQAESIDIAVLDSDAGHTLDEIREAIDLKGWRAIVHSTHSHQTSQTVVAADGADTWMQKNNGTIADYLLSRKGYLPQVVADAAIVDEQTDGNTRSYLVQHAPCPKFRIILPLERPWRAADHREVACAMWRQRIVSLSFALGLQTDQSCSDTSRLFYFPRRREGVAHEFLLLEGDLCPIWDLPDPMPAVAPLAPLAVAARKRQSHGGFNLTRWAAEYGPRFEIATALKARAPGIFGSRVSGVKHHLSCPCAGSHITNQTDQTGSFVVNASDLPKAGLPGVSAGFVIHCSHHGCAGRDRLDFIKKLLDDGTLTSGDLTDPAFLIPAPTATVVAKDRPSNIPSSLYDDLPPVMAAIHGFMCDTGPKPQPALNLGAVLAFMASVVGRKVAIETWNTRPNIYCLGVAHSGAGKERALSACKQIATAAGLFESLIGIEEVASDAGIVSSVVNQPNQLMLIDEMSFLLNAMNQQKSGMFLVNSAATLMKLYSSSATTFKSKSYADSERVRLIDQPCVSLYGCTTPSALVGALTSQNVTSGLLSRLVLFDAGDHDPRARPPENRPVPAVVVDWALAWAKRPLNDSPIACIGGRPVIGPLAVPLTPEAENIREAFDGEMHAAKLRARKHGMDALFVRALENALKFALIRTCSGLPTDALVVDGATMQWACDVSRATLAAMEHHARQIADTPFGQHCRDIVAFIRAGGSAGKTWRDLKRAGCGRHPARYLQELMNHLTDSGEIALCTLPTAGRPREAFVSWDFVEGELAA
jgi:hypothetical protein